MYYVSVIMELWLVIALTQPCEVVGHLWPDVAHHAVVGEAAVVSVEVEVVGLDDAVRVVGLAPGEQSPCVAHVQVL